MKLSLLVQQWRDRSGITNGGQKIAYAQAADELAAALAQQAQPLTDGDLYGIISDAMCAASVGNNKPEARAIRAAVKALRDRMAQQAQLPYKCEKCGATFENWRCTKCMDRVRAQQAQPEPKDRKCTKTASCVHYENHKGPCGLYPDCFDPRGVY